jgi:hypothetical protein
MPIRKTMEVIHVLEHTAALGISISIPSSNRKKMKTMLHTYEELEDSWKALITHRKTIQINDRT